MSPCRSEGRFMVRTSAFHSPVPPAVDPTFSFAIHSRFIGRFPRRWNPTFMRFPRQSDRRLVGRLDRSERDVPAGREAVGRLRVNGTLPFIHFALAGWKR